MILRILKDQKGSASIVTLIYGFFFFALFALVADIGLLYNAKTVVRHSLNLALKSAAEQIDTTYLQDPVNPRIVIKQSEAQAKFNQALQTNLRLNSTFNPAAGSIISGPAEVVFFRVVNSSEIPYTYNYNYPRGTYSETIIRPSVVAIIKVPIKLSGFMRVAQPSAETTSYMYVHGTVSPRLINKHLEEI